MRHSSFLSNAFVSLLVASSLSNLLTSAIPLGFTHCKNTAFAAMRLNSPPTRTSSLKTSVSLDNALPIDILQQALFKSHQSKKARTLKRAYEALKKKKYAEAIALSSRLQHDDTFSDYGLWISASAYRKQAIESMEDESYEAALKAAQKSLKLTLKIEEGTPYSPFIKSLNKNLAESELIMGDSYWGKRKWNLAQQSFENAFQRLQSQSAMYLIKPDPLSHYGESCKKSPTALCTSWLQKFTAVFNRKSSEMKAISQYFSGTAEKNKASKPANKLTLAYKAPDLDQAAYDNAMKFYFDGKYNQTVKSLWQFLDDYPRSANRYRARYWLAQALTQEQEHEKAQKIYEELQQDTPLSYYGLLAANASGKPIDSFLGAAVPQATDTDTALTPQEIIHLKRAKNFVAEQAFDLAGFELKDLKARDGLSSSFLIYLAMLNFKSRNYNTCFQLIGELIQRGYDGIFSTYGMKMIFPLDFLELIKKYSAENELDPILVLSLIKQESSFDEDISSPVGAVGLMQLMPTTAADTSPEVSAAALIGAEANIKVGTRYLKKLLNRFNGNMVLSLAGYNAGPSNIDRWLRDAGQKKGMLEFIESIPFKETREYVGSIIRNYFWYSRILNGISPKGLSYFWNGNGPSENRTQSPAPTPLPIQQEQQKGEDSKQKIKTTES